MYAFSFILAPIIIENGSKMNIIESMCFCFIFLFFSLVPINALCDQFIFDIIKIQANITAYIYPLRHDKNRKQSIKTLSVALSFVRVQIRRPIGYRSFQTLALISFFLLLLTPSCFFISFSVPKNFIWRFDTSGD